MLISDLLRSGRLRRLRRAAAGRFGVPLLAAAAAAALPAGLLGAGQWMRGGQVFRSGIDLVYVAASVVDERGRLVTGLTRDDFLIFESGVQQTVSQFSAERVPVSLGILLDVSDSMHGQRMTDARAALDRFLLDLLAPDDEAFLSTFNHGFRLVAPWTIGPRHLNRELTAIQPFGGTALYDALLASLPLFAGRHHQRAALVIISDGADTASDAELSDVRRTLFRNEAFVYAIGIESAKRSNLNRQVNLQALQEITDPSGGYAELVQSSDELGPATARIAYELNHQYMLGYSPRQPPDGSYRTLRVRIKDRAYRVRARRGYVAEARPATPPRESG